MLEGSRRTWAAANNSVYEHHGSSHARSPHVLQPARSNREWRAEHRRPAAIQLGPRFSGLQITTLCEAYLQAQVSMLGASSPAAATLAERREHIALRTCTSIKSVKSGIRNVLVFFSMFSVENTLIQNYLAVNMACSTGHPQAGFCGT